MKCIRSSWLAIAASLSILPILGCQKLPAASPEGNWEPIFDGNSLNGWVVRIAGHEVGTDPYSTFRASNGVLQVSYDKYPEFKDQFGSLFYDKPLSHYWLRLQYRFVGAPVNGAPQWANRDSGVLIHAQAPNTLAKDQQFPVSVEMNFLGAKLRSRPTGDVCTNSTRVRLANGWTNECSQTSDTSARGDRWVTAEIEVNRNQVLRHYVDGKLAAEYFDPMLDEADNIAKPLILGGVDTRLTSGYLALEANGSPMEFRHIELLVLGE